MQKKRKKILKIGLTGGIGSGKSTIAKYFAKFGVPIIDADVIAREVTAAGTVAAKKISKYFGSEFITKNGTLDRKKLREAIFKDKKKRLWIEKLLHPLIYKQMQQKVETSRAPYCVLVVPLLLESRNKTKFFDRILVVDCPKNVQLKRVLKRDQTAKSVAKAIICTQIDRKARIKQADDVIKNNCSIVSLKKRIIKLHSQYLKLT